MGWVVFASLIWNACGMKGLKNAEIVSLIFKNTSGASHPQSILYETLYENTVQVDMSQFGPFAAFRLDFWRCQELESNVFFLCQSCSSHPLSFCSFFKNFKFKYAPPHLHNHIFMKLNCLLWKAVTACAGRHATWPATTKSYPWSKSPARLQPATCRKSSTSQRSTSRE